MKDELSRGYPLKNIDAESTSNCKINYSGKLNVFNWLDKISLAVNEEEIFEVRFKNTRKGYFYNSNNLQLDIGDIVAVEASPGHDIGIISLKGPLVLHQLNKLKQAPTDLKIIYRKAKANDIDKWKNAIETEHKTMIETRKISSDLNLNMKIGDVEYQGDKTKAIFYYIADERVDFRELIKILAEKFKVRIEMRQIGARQESARIGGIGSCGRELCCSTFVNNFVSVNTNSARYQELSLNPQKLAGQCGKLKCCLNYELSTYKDHRKDFPSSEIVLELAKGRATHFKTDVFRSMMWYVLQAEEGNTIMPISVESVKDIIQKNKKGEKPNIEIQKEEPSKIDNIDFTNVVGQESLTRFDQNKRKKQKRKKKKYTSRKNNNNNKNEHFNNKKHT